MTPKELNIYDRFCVAFSGGKDSIACFLHLLELDIPKDKIELHHCLIDAPGESFMDWEITEDYCRQFAKAFGVPIYFMYKEGGFKREMLRNGTATAPIAFETENKTLVKVGGAGPIGTRLKFPQISPDLSVRWCSSYMKVDTGASAIRNQKRFEGIKTCVLSGERGEESAARSKYAILEIDRAGKGTKMVDGLKVPTRTKKRYVDRWRPIRDWKEAEVWAIAERWKVRMHPCYYLGFSRCSCKFCIFGNADQFKTAYTISPKQGSELISLEADFGVTLKRKETLPELISKGTVYSAVTEELVALATGFTYFESIFVVGEWVLPAGAFKEGCGPT